MNKKERREVRKEHKEDIKKFRKKFRRSVGAVKPFYDYQIKKWPREEKGFFLNRALEW